jgi:hypothetical protein
LRGCERIALVAMVEADACRGPLLTTLFEDDLSHRGVCQDTKVRAVRVGQIVRGRGIRASGSSRVDSYNVRPYTNIRPGQMRLVGFKSQLVKSRMPVRVRLGVLWQIGDMERTANAHGIGTVVDLMLLLLCGIGRFDEILAFLVERPSGISGSLKTVLCGRSLTSGHPIPILHCQAAPTHPGPRDLAGSRS